MSRGKGESATTLIVLAGFILVIVGTLIYSFVGNKEAADAGRSATGRTSTNVPDEITVESVDADSLDSIDGVVYSGFFGLGVYYRTHTPVARATPVAPGIAADTKAPKDAGAPGKPEDVSGTVKKGKFLRIPGADPATFVEIKKVPASKPNPVAPPEATTEVTYYHDSTQVFIAQTTVDPSGAVDTTVEPVTADPATFQILNDTYAKDTQYVYVVSWVCEGETCTLVLVIVQGADPATFHPIQETVFQQSGGNGTVTADAVDKSHLFSDGTIVDSIATPGSGNGVDLTPILISP